jgi:hypothetical protein
MQRAANSRCDILRRGGWPLLIEVWAKAWIKNKSQKAATATRAVEERFEHLVIDHRRLRMICVEGLLCRHPLFALAALVGLAGV